MVIFLLQRRGDVPVSGQPGPEGRSEETDVYRDLLGQGFDLILRLSPDGEICDTSPSVTRILGYGENEVIGRSLFDMVPGDQIAALDQALAALRAGEPVEGFRVQVSRKGTGRADLEVHALPVRGEDGTVTRICAIARDVTELVEVKRQRDIAYSQLERDNRQFAMLADHIRNPLQSIMGASQLSTDERMQEIIQEQVNRIESFLKILDQGWERAKEIREYSDREAERSRDSDAGDQR